MSDDLRMACYKKLSFKIHFYSALNVSAGFAMAAL